MLLPVITLRLLLNLTELISEPYIACVKRTSMRLLFEVLEKHWYVRLQDVNSCRK